MAKKRLNRRDFLRLSAMAAAGALSAACAPATSQVVEKPVTVIVEKEKEVEKEVTVIVEKEKVVEKPVEKVVTTVVEKEKIVEKVVTATPSGPSVGGVLLTPIASEPPGLDPCNPWNVGSAGVGMGPAYDSWLIWGRDITLEPSVAESWTEVDETTYNFQIRKGVKFHHLDRDFTAADAVWSYERMINPDLGCAGADIIRDRIASMEALDTYTLQVKLVKPLLRVNRVWLPPIMAPECVESYEKGEILLQAECGTGPWILNEVSAQSYISYVRNPDYWDKPPLLEELRFVVMPEERSQVAAMRTGQLNFMAGFSYEAYMQLKDLPNITIHSYPSSGYFRLNVNHHREAMQDKNVLQALLHGLNRKQMVDTLTGGLGVEAGFVPRAAEGYAISDEELAELQKFDVELAKSFLAKSGYNETDNRLQLTLITIAGWQHFLDIAQIVQANLKDIGIDVEIRIQEVGVWVDARLNTKNYDLSVNDWGTSITDPDFTAWRSDKAEQEWTGGAEQMPELYPEFDELHDAFDVETDEGKRKELCQEMERLIISTVRELFLFSRPAFEAVSTDLVGYEPWPGSPGTLRAFDWEQVYHSNP